MAVPVERGRKRELSCVLGNHVSLVETHGWSAPAVEGARQSVKRSEHSTIAPPQTPIWPTLPADRIGGPPRGHTTTRATRSNQLGCCCLAHWIRKGGSNRHEKSCARSNPCVFCKDILDVIIPGVHLGILDGCVPYRNWESHPNRWGESREPNQLDYIRGDALFFLTLNIVGQSSP